MTKRFLAACVAALAIAPGALAAGGSSFSITEAGGSAFPMRSYVLSLHETAALTADRVRVVENGVAVPDVELVPESARGRARFGVVLVVDASDSMAGSPLEGAMAAARAFAARRSTSQELALIVFNRRATTVRPFTRSNSAIAASLDATPRVAYGTHIYDAVGSALTLLRASHVDSGSIVLLSDGSDTGSRTSMSVAIKHAHAAHVRLFTVGLRSRHFDPVSLSALAYGSGGSYAEASSPAKLAGLYDRLGAQLAHEYLLRYRSFAGPAEKVRVSVRVAGVSGTARARYRAPALDIQAPAVFRRSIFDRAILSPITAAAVALLSALFAGLAIFAVLRPRNLQLRRRIGEFVSLAAAPGPEGDPDAAPTPGRASWLARLDRDLEIAEVDVPARTLLIGTLAGTLVLCLVFGLVAGSPFFAVFGLALPLLVRGYVKRKLQHRRAQFGEQLPDTLQVVSSALRAGHSLAGALAVVVDGASEPTRHELQRVVADEQLGVPLEDALAVVVARMDNRDLEQLAFVAKLQRETGGSAAEVIDRVTETVRERFELRRLVGSLTAQGRLSRWVVSLLPVGLLLVIALLNPHYINPLFTKPAGQAMLVAASVLVVGGSLVIKRIVDIKV